MSETKEPPQIHIREMELEDLPKVFALGEALFTAESWPNLYRTWDEYEPVEFFGSDGETCFVAEDEETEKLLGFVLGTVIEKRRSAWTYGYLVWLAVDPDARRFGVGSRLTEKLTETFIELGARMMLVDTDAENETALAFFESHGFGHPRNHVYMTRNLTTTSTYKRLRGESGRRGRHARGPLPEGGVVPGDDE